MEGVAGTTEVKSPSENEVVFMGHVPIYQMVCTCRIVPAGFLCNVMSVEHAFGESVTGRHVVRDGQDTDPDTIPFTCPIFFQSPPAGKRHEYALVQPPFYNLPMDFIPNVDAAGLIKKAYRKYCKCGE